MVAPEAGRPRGEEGGPPARGTPPLTSQSYYRGNKTSYYIKYYRHAMVYSAMNPASKAFILIRASFNGSGSESLAGYIFLQCAVPAINTEGC